MQKGKVDNTLEKMNYTQEDLNDHHGVAVVIKNTGGQILMQKHIKYGFWTIPVGKVKLNQSLEEGVREEIFEECNLVVKEMKKLTSKTYEYNRLGKNVKVFSHLFEALEYSGQMQNKEPEKHREQRFMDLEEIKNLPYLSDLTLLLLSFLGFNREARL